MGQVCCIQDDKKGKESREVNDHRDTGGWRSMAQTALDFEQMDLILNRWKPSEIPTLQVFSP